MRKALFAIFGMAAMFAACSQTVSASSNDDEEKASATESSDSKGADDGSSGSGSSEDVLDKDCVGEPGKPWDGTTAKEFACGSGTKLSPYIIVTAEQLAKLAFIVGANEKEYEGKYYKLAADIKLNDGKVIDDKGALVADSSKLHKWTPIGNSSVAFTGNFDGNGHTVSGMFINTTSSHNGLFGNNQGTVFNLILKDSWIGGGDYTAGIAGANGGTIDGVKNYGSIVGNKDCVGGIAGQSNGPYPKTSSIKNSVNYGFVTGKTFVGGITGQAYQAAIDNSENFGLVEGNTNVGGIAGRGGYTYVSSYLINSSNVINHAQISGSGDNVGGIFGSAGYASPSISGNQTIATLTFAKNSGKVLGKNYIGGIIGMANRVNVQKAANEADVEGEKYVSGVVGKLVSSTTQFFYNTGDISGSQYVGGVVGDNQEGVTNSAYSTGKVDGDSLVGLMIGYNYNTTMADYYYLKQGDQEPFGQNNGGGVATPKTETEMKSANFAKLLGDDFVYDSGLNDGYPVLAWEKE